VYLIELRPNDYSIHGFLLPENQIIPTGRETWAGVQAVADEVLRRTGVQPLAPDGGNNSGQAQQECVDKDQYCRWWTSLGACHAWREQMMKSCPKSCDFCGQIASAISADTTEEVCEDTRTDCPTWVRMKLCSWVELTCRRSCSFCL